ncbi:MAG: HAD family hydrolase [Bacillota bacterium]
MSKLAVYDFDGTLINKESVPIIMKTYKKMKLGFWIYIGVYWFLLTRLVAYKLPFTSSDKATFRAHAMMKMADLYRTLDKPTRNALFNAIYNALTPYLNQTVVDAIKHDKENGFHTVLLSGSFIDVLTPFKALGFDRVIGSTLIKDGQVLAYKDIDILIDQKKLDVVKALKKQLQIDYVKAVADSYYDLKLLNYADEAVAVHPDDTLKAYALSHDWEIIE